MMTELHAAEPDTVTLSAETVRVLILQESVLQQKASDEEPARSFDPYNTDVTAQVGRLRPKGAA